jgi:hypothetical protein
MEARIAKLEKMCAVLHEYITCKECKKGMKAKGDLCEKCEYERTKQEYVFCDKCHTRKVNMTWGTPNYECPKCDRKRLFDNFGSPSLF